MFLWQEKDGFSVHERSYLVWRHVRQEIKLWTAPLYDEMSQRSLRRKLSRSGSM